MAMHDSYPSSRRFNVPNVLAIVLATGLAGVGAQKVLGPLLDDPDVQRSALVTGKDGLVRAHVDRPHISKGIILNTEHWLFMAQCRNEANLDAIPSDQLDAREQQAAHDKVVLKLGRGCLEDVVKVNDNTSERVSDGAIIAVPGPYNGQRAPK